MHFLESFFRSSGTSRSTSVSGAGDTSDMSGASDWTIYGRTFKITSGNLTPSFLDFSLSCLS